jgi:hypothetical protein
MSGGRIDMGYQVSSNFYRTCHFNRSGVKMRHWDTCVLKNDRHSRGYSGFLLVLHRVSLLPYVSKRHAIFPWPHLSGHLSGRFRTVLNNRHASETLWGSSMKYIVPSTVSTVASRKVINITSTFWETLGLRKTKTKHCSLWSTFISSSHKMSRKPEPVVFDKS